MSTSFGHFLEDEKKTDTKKYPRSWVHPPVAARLSVGLWTLSVVMTL